MPYIGKQLSNGNYLKLDDISSSFNGSTTTFSLTNGGSAYYPGSEFSILVSVGGVIQEPESAYQINNDEITFANAPTAQDSFFCVVLGDAIGINVPGNNTVNGAQMAKPFNYDGGLLYLNDTDNRVGINSTSPSVALDVVGDLNVSGNISGIGGTLGGTLVGNVYASSGISTFNDLLVNGDLTVQGDTTTLNTTLRNVELLRVASNSTATAGIVTQTGAGDILNLFDGTSEVLTVVDTGEVGIGTVTPNAPLDVFSNTAATDKDLLMVRSSTGAFAVQCSDITAANPEWSLRTYSGEPIVFSPGNVEKVRISSGGNVGIGSASPGEKLDVNGSIRSLANNFPTMSATFDARYDATHLLSLTVNHNSSTAQEVLGTWADNGGANPRTVINASNGWKVGIGTINPGFKLDVDYTNNAEDGIRILNRASGSSSTSMLRLGNDENINAAFLMLNSSGYGSVGGAYNLVLGHGLSRDIVFATGGSEKLRIKSDGKLAIGHTGTASHDIHVKHANSPGIRLEDTTNTVKLTMFAQDANSGIANFSNHDMIFYTNSLERVRITSGGNVGIGTDTASGKLTVRTEGVNQTMFLLESDMGSNNNRTLYVKSPTTDSSSEPFTFHTGNSMQFKTDANLGIRIHSDGKVGINTDASMTEALEVDGDIRVKNAVKFRVPAGVGGSGAENAVLGLVSNDEFTFESYGTNGYFTWNTGSSVTEMMRLTTAGKLGLGSTDPQMKLHVQSGSLAEGTILCGANYNAAGMSNNAAKAGAIHAPHYASDTYPKGFRAYGVYADNGVSMVQIGGGTNDARSATDIRFYASSSATANGTEVGRFNYDGTNTHARFQVDSDNNSAAGTKFVVGSGNNVSATVLINTEDTDIDALLLSNWDGSTTTNRVFAAFDSSGLGGFKVGMPAATDAFVVKDWGGSEYIHIDATGRLGFKMTPGVWNTNNQTVLQLSGTNAGLNLFTRAGAGFLTSNFWYKSDDAGVFQAASGYGLMQQIDAANGQFKYFSSTTTSSSADSSASMIEKFRIGPGYTGSIDVKGIPAYLRLYSTRDTSDWDSTDPIGKLDFYVGDDTTNNLPYTASFIHSINEDDNVGEPSGSLRFGTATANMSGGAIERLRITGAGRVIMDNQSGNTDFSDGYAACEIRGSGTTKQLVLSNSTSTNDKTAGIYFKVNHSGQDERVKGGILYENPGSGYGRGNMLFCCNPDDDNANVDSGDERMRIAHTGVISVPGMLFSPSRGVGVRSGALLYFSGAQSTTNSAFDMFKIYNVHGQSSLSIELFFHHSGGGTHGSWARGNYNINSYDAVEQREYESANWGGGGGFTISRAASPNNQYVTVRYNG